MVRVVRWVRVERVVLPLCDHEMYDAEGRSAGLSFPTLWNTVLSDRESLMMERLFCDWASNTRRMVVQKDK